MRVTSCSIPRGQFNGGRSGTQQRTLLGDGVGVGPQAGAVVHGPRWVRGVQHGREHGPEADVAGTDDVGAAAEIATVHSEEWRQGTQVAWGGPLGPKPTFPDFFWKSISTNPSMTPGERNIWRESLAGFPLAVLQLGRTHYQI